MTLGIGVAFAMSACTRPSAPSASPASAPITTNASSIAARQLPKYPAHARPLSREHAFLQRAPAPDFWALVPYYVGQVGDAACSAASLTMLVNAARHTRALDSEAPLVSQALLRERVASASWEKGLAPDGEGVTLDQLAVLAEQSLSAFGLQARRVQVTHVPDTSADALARWRAVLHDNERSADDWLFVNFLASTYVGVGDCDLVPQVRAGGAAPPLRCEGRVDPGPMGHSALGASSTFGPDPAQTPGLSYGHIAPVGAYDEPNRRVLVMDPDRAWYEPYWIPDDVALAGMATRDPVSGAPRGYLIVSVCEGACASGRLESDPGRMMRSTGVPPGPAASGKKLRWLTGSTATEWAPSAG